MPLFLFEKKKSKKKKKKKYKHSPYHGRFMNGGIWWGRQGIYHPILPPPPPPMHCGPGCHHPGDAGAPDAGPSGFDGGGAPMGEDYEPIDDQFVNIMSFDKDGKEIKKTTSYFNKERFKKALTDGIVRFVFTKVNGSKREAYGTTNLEILRKYHAPDVYKNLRPNSTTIRFFDMQKQAWRSFRPDSLTTIYETLEESRD